MYLHSIEFLARVSTDKEPAYQKNLTFSLMCGIIAKKNNQFDSRLELGF